MKRAHLCPRDCIFQMLILCFYSHLNSTIIDTFLVITETVNSLLLIEFCLNFLNGFPVKFYFILNLNKIRAFLCEFIELTLTWPFLLHVPTLLQLHFNLTSLLHSLIYVFLLIFSEFF